MTTRVRARMRGWAMVLFGLTLGFVSASSTAARAEILGPIDLPDPLTLVHSAIDLACAAHGIADLDKIGHRLPGLAPVDPTPGLVRLISGIRRVFRLPHGNLTVDWLTPRGDPHHIRLQFDLDAGSRPYLYAAVDPDCAIHTARRIRYDGQGRPAGIEHLDHDLRPTGHEEPVDPPVPLYPDPTGVPVALIDTGVNYTLPTIGARLARAADGTLLGYDYWDLDDRPFDANPSRSPFFPGRHGTEVASLVITEAPVAKLLPYRYPRPEMRRLGALIDHAAAHGARLVNLSLASFDLDEWQTFLAAIDRHPEILFVVAAGNHSRDIDRRPVYPAAAKRPNLITVTAADAEGHLAHGVNWGASSVDVMAPAAPVSVLDFDGSGRLVTGSSYATARVTGLAACLAAAYPGWTTAQLKAEIFALAEPTEEPGRVAIGFLPEDLFGQRSACATRRPNTAI